MTFLTKLAIMAGWFMLVVVVMVTVWSLIIWLINRKAIGSTGAAGILVTVLFGALWLCAQYK